MTEKLQRDIDNIRKHIAFGNKESAQRIAGLLVRSAKTEKARNAIIAALKGI